MNLKRHEFVKQLAAGAAVTAIAGCAETLQHTRGRPGRRYRRGVRGGDCRENTYRCGRRIKKIVSFLGHIRADASHIIVAGDIFDFWYEYKTVVPKHFVRACSENLLK